VARWVQRLSRNHRPHEFDEVVEKVKRDLGLDALDAVALRRRYLDKWRKQLDLLDSGYSFQEEARKLVETSIVTEMIATPPLTAKDIMEEFGLPPGPEVGRYRRLAQELFDAAPCSQAELLERLGRRVDGDGVN
jgi:hypothetical protein